MKRPKNASIALGNVRAAQTASLSHAAKGHKRPRSEGSGLDRMKMEHNGYKGSRQQVQGAAERAATEVNPDKTPTTGVCTEQIGVGPCGKTTPDMRIPRCAEHGGEYLAKRLGIRWPL